MRVPRNTAYHIVPPAANIMLSRPIRADEISTLMSLELILTPCGQCAVACLILLSGNACLMLEAACTFCSDCVSCELLQLSHDAELK